MVQRSEYSLNKRLEHIHDFFDYENPSGKFLQFVLTAAPLVGTVAALWNLQQPLPIPMFDIPKLVALGFTHNQQLLMADGAISGASALIGVIVGGVLALGGDEAGGGCIGVPLIAPAAIQIGPYIGFGYGLRKGLEGVAVGLTKRANKVKTN